MDKEKLRAILKKHKKWIDYDDGGERADLSDTDLSGENLSGADLRHANLEEADLTQADLRYANLRHAITEQMVGKSVISVQVDTSRPNNTISYWVDLGIWTTGCFQGSLDELKEKIEETHKDNAFLRERYYRVIHFILQEADEDNGRIEGK
ncbi:pentapeptide repeat-containing protein [Peptoniphilus sp. HCN-40583]|uniref:pentapeptide repeat-containing protein n=1 Tax=Peptoniphilus sp. HCN-40583 TaxID=3134662 RepID=UPI0030BBC358